MKTKHVAVWSLEKDELLHFKIWVVEMVVLFTPLQWKIAQNSQDLTFVPWFLEKWWWFDVCDLPFWCFNKVYRHFDTAKVHGLKCANAGFVPEKKLVYDVHLSNIERTRLLGIPYNQCKQIHPGWCLNPQEQGKWLQNARGEANRWSRVPGIGCISEKMGKVMSKKWIEKTSTRPKQI